MRGCVGARMGTGTDERLSYCHALPALRACMCAKLATACPCVFRSFCVVKRTVSADRVVLCIAWLSQAVTVSQCSQ